MECLDDNAASEFVSGALGASAVTAVETHLAGCRDCRALVAALAGDEADSNAATHRHEKVVEDSQVAKRPTLSIGDRVGRYLVLSSLGAGGMGVVFAAYDPQLDRKVALKLLRANLAGANAKEARTRLKREAQAIAQLNHPNVVGVYDVGTTDAGDVYIAMEFIEGDTLTTWLKRWPRTWREILEVFHQAARGLMAAHSVGLLHRDFKPDNVLVGADGRVRVTDFGLARSLFLDDSARGPIPTSPSGSQKPADGSPLQVDLTATGTVLGTPRYMPPEQLTGPSIDARADQFSFCVALYEALWGKHPLPGATSVSMLEHGDRAIAPPENSKVPAAIVRAVMRGLEKERSKRFPTLSALVHELTPPQQRSPVRVIAAAAIGALLVGGAAAAMMTRPTVTQRVDPPDERAVKLLIDEINRRDQEIKQLRKIIVEGTKDRAELVAVKRALDEAQAKVRELEEKVVDLRAKQVPNVAKAPAIIGVKSRDITEAIQVVQRDIEGCFDEWAERAHLAQPHAAGEPAPLRVRDADVVVMLSVTPDGVGYSASAKGIESPSTRLCLESALAQVRYPTGPDALDVRIDIAWLSGNLDMTARIVGHHEAAGSTLLDL